MGESKRKVSDPVLPDIETCPRCGANILIGDERCSACGYDVMTTSDRLKKQPPIVISTAFFVIGVLLALAALTGMDGWFRALFLLLAGGLVVSGGLYYAYDLLILNSDDQRKPRQ